MTRAGSILFFLSFIPFFTISQEEFLDKKECNSLISNANALYSQNKYFEATSVFLKSELGCSDFNVQNYTKLISSLKNSISGEINKERKKAYIDTLIIVFDRCESKKMYDETNDFNRATYILKSNFPNHQRADSLFVRAIDRRIEDISEINLTMYYYSLYTLYNTASIENRNKYKKRLIFDFFKMNELISNFKMSEQTAKNISTYLNNVIKNYEDILPVLPIYLKELPVKKEDKILELINYKRILEYKSFDDSKEYIDIIDSLLLIQPTKELYLSKAKFLRGVKDFEKEIFALKSAKMIASDGDAIFEIDYLIADCFFHLRNFSQSYKNAILISGPFETEAKILAAESVISMIDSCGINLVEQKLNYIHAFQIVANIKEKSELAINLMKKCQNGFPTKEELNLNGLKPAQKYYLKCWDVEIVLPE